VQLVARGRERAHGNRGDDREVILRENVVARQVAQGAPLDPAGYLDTRRLEDRGREIDRADRIVDDRAEPVHVVDVVGDGQPTNGTEAVEHERNLSPPGIDRVLAVSTVVAIDIGGTKLKAMPTEYEDRTTPDGKTSSVHWVRFVFTPELRKNFANSERRVLLSIEHPNYGHMAVVSPEVRAELSRDFASPSER